MKKIQYFKVVGTDDWGGDEDAGLFEFYEDALKVAQHFGRVESAWLNLFESVEEYDKHSEESERLLDTRDKLMKTLTTHEKKALGLIVD